MLDDQLVVSTIQLHHILKGNCNPIRDCTSPPQRGHFWHGCKSGGPTRLSSQYTMMISFIPLGVEWMRKFHMITYIAQVSKVLKAIKQSGEEWLKLLFSINPSDTAREWNQTQGPANTMFPTLRRYAFFTSTFPEKYHPLPNKKFCTVP